MFRFVQTTASTWSPLKWVEPGPTECCVEPGLLDLERYLNSVSCFSPSIKNAPGRSSFRFSMSPLSGIRIWVGAIFPPHCLLARPNE